MGAPSFSRILREGGFFDLALLRRGHSRNGLKVVRDLNTFPISQQFLNAFRNCAADLHYQPAAWFHDSACLWNQPFDHLQTRGSGEYRISRLELADLELD